MLNNYPIRLLLLLSILIVNMNLNAQENKLQVNSETTQYVPTPSHPELFKYVPLLDASTPEWAVLMYGDNPNVHEVEAAYNVYHENHQFVKSIHTQNYKLWQRNLRQGHYVQADGSIIIPTETEYKASIAPHLTQWNKNNDSQEKVAGNWTAIGPFLTSEQGVIKSWQVNTFTIDQSLSNADVLYAGTETAAVFKSIDKGENWTCVSESLVLNGNGINTVKIHPTNPDIAFFGEGHNLYKTTDGGTNWTVVHNVANLFANDISINPANPLIVLVSSARGLYRSIDGGTNWTQIYSENCSDIEIHPTTSNIVYLLKSNPTAGMKHTEFYKSTDSGATFTLKSSGWYTPISTSTDGGARMTVTKAPGGADYIYVALLGNDVSYAQDVNWLGVYKSTDAGENWTLPVTGGDPGGPYTATHLCIPTFNPLSQGTYDQGYYNLGIAASDTNKEHFLLGCLNLFKSLDGGVTYTHMGGYGGSGPGNQHPDIQEIEINGNDVWVSHDGGVNLYSSDWSSMTPKTKGINGSEYWGFGQGWNVDVVTGGRYHNGNSARLGTYPAGEHLRLGGGEAPTGFVGQFGTGRNVYHADIGGKELPVNVAGAVTNISNYAVYPSGTIANELRGEIIVHPQSYNTLYLGQNNAIMKSIDNGITFNTLFTFGSTTTNVITKLEISRTNPDKMYVVQSGTTDPTLWKSTNGGTSWTAVSLPVTEPSNSLFITIDPVNDDNVWIGYNHGGNSTNKIFKSTVGGGSWTNLTTSTLDGHNVEDLVMQIGTNGGVYLATNLSAFYRNNTHGDWQVFNTGLPAKTANNTLIPFYRDGKIRTATYNRGIWESPLFEPSTTVVQPVVDKLTTTCANDVFYFDDYSVVNHAGAVWSWSFSPAAQSVSNANIRNPEVVFGNPGTYTATMTLDGISKDLTITVGGDCVIETLAGNALVLSNTGDYIEQNAALGITTNTMTMSAWIKPNGSQNSFTGIIATASGNGGTSLNYFSGNRLGYTWNNTSGSYNYNSGLVIPQNEWSHVALVVTPTTATLYLNGVSATNTHTHNTVDFSQKFQFGIDRGNTTRNFKGSMDEIAIYNRAMSTDEIRELMHLTRNNPNAGALPAADADLVAYYQMNETTGVSLDKIGSKHSILIGGATRATSTAPVGGGTFQRMDVSSGGLKAFTTSGVDITFPATGTYPNGDLVVTRIDNAPDHAVGTDPTPATTYWIVNNYGVNSTFSTLESMKFSGLSGIGAFATPYTLYKRSSTAEGDTWGLAQDFADVSTPTTLTFSTDNGITSFSQFAINNSSALPVELVKFGAETAADKQVRVYWETETEINNDFFTVEWSTDGRIFSKIGKVESQSSNSTERLDYDFMHKTPQRGINYYRLKQVDLDGSFEYSDIKSVVFNALASEFVVYPNPLPSGSQLNIKTSSDEEYSFVIYNAKGHWVYKGKYQGDATVDLTTISSGFYSYQIEMSSKLMNGKLIVE